MFTSALFLVSLFVFHTFSTGLEKPAWLDDVDGPKFLREAKQPGRAEEKDLDSIDDPWQDDIDGPTFLRGADKQIQDEKDLDSIYDLPREWTGVVSDSNIIFASSKSESMISKVAAAPDGINTTTWNPNSAVNSPNGTLARCRPFPTMVELPRAPGENWLQASHVILHRCVGSCLQENDFNCTVTRQEEIKYKVQSFTIMEGTLNMTTKTFIVYNHTDCACNCRKRESACNKSIENYNVDICGCECISNGSHCSVNHKWSPISCHCQCSNPPICDETVRQFLNETTCDCDCPQKVKNRCKRKGKVLNKQTCECECPTPKPVCGPGTSFLKYNCTCV